MTFSTRLQILFSCAHSKTSYSGDAYSRRSGPPLSAESVQELERLGLRGKADDAGAQAGIQTETRTPDEPTSSDSREAAIVMAMSRPAPPIPESIAAPVVLPAVAAEASRIKSPSNDSLLSMFGLCEKQMSPDGAGLSLYRAVMDQMERFYPRNDGALTPRELLDHAKYHREIARGWSVPAPYENVEERQLALSMQINLHMIANGVSCCLNKEAAKKGLPRLTIVRVEGESGCGAHYNSTEPK